MTKNNIQGIPLFTAFLLFLFIDPYFMWRINNSTNLYFYFSFIAFFLFTLNIDLKAKGRKILFFLFFVLLLYMPFSQKQNYNAYILSLSVCTIPFMKENFARATYEYLLTIYSFIIFLSGIVWLLTLVGAVPSIGIIEPLNELKPYNYIKYPLLVVDNVGGFTRFNGPFDEPGVVGTMSVFFLTINSFNFKDKRLLPILVTGLFSLSLFFYAVLFLYYVLVPLFKNNSNNKLYYIGLILLLVVLAFFSYHNDLMYNYIWSRFEWDDTKGSFAGDNRISEFGKELLLSMIGTNEFLWGVSDYSLYNDDFASFSSILMPIIKYGIVFMVLYLILFLVYGFINKNDDILYLFFALVLLGTLYQRPCLTEPEFLFFFSLMATNVISGHSIKQQKEASEK